MTKNKSNPVKSNSIPCALSEYKDYSQRLSQFTLTQLIIRLSKCRKALKEYGDIPSYSQAVDEMSSRLDKAREQKNKCVEFDKLNVDTSLLEEKTLPEICAEIFKNLGKEDLYDTYTLGLCINYCLALLALQEGIEFKNVEEVFDRNSLELYTIQISSEALGYWTAKLEHMKRSKNQETKKQQREIKEDYVIDAWLHLTKDNNRKNILISKSLNKMAKEIYDYVYPLLKDKKTKTGKFVLTRSKRTDKDGKPILSGLDTDTIIDIMRNTKTDKIKTNPFKK